MTTDVYFFCTDSLHSWGRELAHRGSFFFSHTHPGRGYTTNFGCKSRSIHTLAASTSTRSHTHAPVSTTTPTQPSVSAHAAAATGASASVAGVAVVAAAPVAAAVGLGFGVYKLAQWLSDED